MGFRIYDNRLAKRLTNFLAFALVCGATAVPLSFTVTLEQALLASSLPIACVWAVRELPAKDPAETPCPGTRWTLCMLAAVAFALLELREESYQCLLSLCALTSIALNSTGFPLALPAASFFAIQRNDCTHLGCNFWW